MLLTWTGASQAQVEIPADTAAPLPGFAGDGLNGLVFKSTTTNINTIDQAESFIAVNDPIGSFRSTLLDYPNGPTVNTGIGDTVGNFLGVDAAGLDPAAAATLENTIYEFTGFLRIDLAGDYVFAVGSDDGVRLTIGGVQLFETNDRGFTFAGTVATARFDASGLYPVRLLYYSNNVGVAGLQFNSSIAGGPDYGSGPSEAPFVVPTSLLYTVVPEPPAQLLTALGLSTGLVALAFRRRRA